MNQSVFLITFSFWLWCPNWATLCQCPYYGFTWFEKQPQLKFSHHSLLLQLVIPLITQAGPGVTTGNSSVTPVNHIREALSNLYNSPSKLAPRAKVPMMESLLWVCSCIWYHCAKKNEFRKIIMATVRHQYSDIFIFLNRISISNSINYFWPITIRLL